MVQVELESDEERQARHLAAIAALETFNQRHNLTLGPEVTFKDFINEGRRDLI